MVKNGTSEGSGDHYEILTQCLTGHSQKRQPFSLWRHFPEADQTPEGFARMTIDWQKKWDFDFVKVTPAGTYSVREYGVRDLYTGDPFGRCETIVHPVTHPDHWKKIIPVDPESGFPGQQLYSLRLIRSALGSSAPIIQTIFSPLAQLEKIAGTNLFYQHLNDHPDIIDQVLPVLTENTVEFIRACIQTGVDGIFYVVRANLPETEAIDLYRKYGMSYDSMCLKAAGGLWLNILHLHAEWCQISDFIPYSTQLISMDRVENPDVIAGALKERSTKFLGGFYRDHLVESDKEMTEVFNRYRSALDLGFVAGANCTLALATSEKIIHKARKLVNSVPS
jgi:uroporphyrinogen decarboxylase